MSKRSRLIGVVLTTGLFAGAVLLWFALSSPTSSSCKPLVEAKPSPQGSWVAERRYGCDGYVEFSLRQAETQHVRSGDIFVSFFPGEYSVDLLFKWLSESELLIAIPQGNDRVHWPTQFRALEKPDKLHGVRLNYAIYPSDPDLARDTGSRTIVRKRVPFDYQFKASKDEGDRSLACTISLTIVDREYFDRMQVGLNASKTPAQLVWKGGARVPMAERSLAGIRISAHQKIGNFTSEPTAAAFGSIHPSEPQLIDRGLTPTAPTWQAMWWPIEPKDFTAALNKIREGAFDIKVGFWLDNLEVVYSSSDQVNPGAVDDFERCLSEDAIFVGAP
jgi:hypothetical protein